MINFIYKYIITTKKQGGGGGEVKMKKIFPEKNNAPY